MKGNKNVYTRDNKHSVDCTGACETCESLRIIVDPKIGLLRTPMCANIQVVGRICFDAPHNPIHDRIRESFISGKTTGYPINAASWICRGEWFKKRKTIKNDDLVVVPTHTLNLSDLVIRENGNHTIPMLRFLEEVE